MNTDKISLFDIYKLDEQEKEQKNINLLQKLKNKKLELKLKNQKIKKKQMNKSNELIKNETKNIIVNDKIISYYIALEKKNKKILKPSEILNSNKSDFIYTSEILELYYVTKLDYNIIIPLAHEIYINKEKYLILYNNFLENIFNKINDLPQEKRNEEYKILLNNSYYQYLTKCLQIY